MDFFKKSGSKRIEHGKGATEDAPGQIIQPALICMNLRASSFICVKILSFAMPPTHDCQIVTSILPSPR
jgi:hypothetical protein